MHVQTSRGIQLFICFVHYYEWHCIHSRRHHVAILLILQSLLHDDKQMFLGQACMQRKYINNFLVSANIHGYIKRTAAREPAFNINMWSNGTCPWQQKVCQKTLRASLLIILPKIWP